MARIVIYDLTTNRVKQVLESVNTPDYDGRSDVLINPDVPVGVALKYLTVVGNAVVEMDTAEKSAVDQSEVDSAKLAVRQSAQGSVDAFSDVGILFRAFAKVLLSEINTLRAQHSLAPRTVDQLKAVMKSAINNGDVDV